MPSNPWLKTVTLTSNGTAYNLLTLMQVVDKAAPPRCAKLNIQLDLSAGAANLLVGNEDVSATNYGAVLVAGQAIVWETGETNDLVLNQISLWATSGSSVRVNVNAHVY